MFRRMPALEERAWVSLQGICDISETPSHKYLAVSYSGSVRDVNHVGNHDDETFSQCSTHARIIKAWSMSEHVLQPMLITMVPTMQVRTSVSWRTEYMQSVGHQDVCLT